MNSYHTSVLLQEVIEYLQIKPGSMYIDATLGGGGHTIEILKKGGRVLGIDADQDSIDEVKHKFSIFNFQFSIGKEVILVKGNFRDIDTIVRSQGITSVAGILFDLGVSSHQLDTAERGFSFQKEGPLDMRMDSDLGVKAKDLINVLGKKELYELFDKYGEERFAWAISEAIVRARTIKPIETTRELVAVIEHSVPKRWDGIHPATKVFQALRIAVNDELQTIQEALPKAIEILDKGGRIVVISFHSLEDRIVKQCFQETEKNNKGKIITKKPIVPIESESTENPRARSAKLRVLEKI